MISIMTPAVIPEQDHDSTPHDLSCDSSADILRRPRKAIDPNPLYKEHLLSLFPSAALPFAHLLLIVAAPLSDF